MLRLNHKKLDVWKLAIEFVVDIYELTKDFPKNEIYGVTNQIRRAAVSIPSNIAEGASRSSALERKRFYEIARSFLVELDTQLEICLKLNYYSAERVTAIVEKLNHLFVMISKLRENTK